MRKKEYPRFCFQKRPVFPRLNLEFEKKVDQNHVFSMKNAAKMLINS